MESKDWIIVALLLVAFGGPLGVHLFHTRRKDSMPALGGDGTISGTTPGAPAIDDGRRIGAAIGMTGGRSFTEAGKASAIGPKKYGNREHHHEHMQTGGAV